MNGQTALLIAMQWPIIVNNTSRHLPERHGHQPIRISHLQGMQFTTNSSTPSMCWLVWQWDSWIHELNSIWLICWTPHVFISISFWLLLSFCPSFNLLPSRDAVGDQFQHILDVLSGITMGLLNLGCRGLSSGLLYYIWYYLVLIFYASILWVPYYARKKTTT